MIDRIFRVIQRILASSERDRLEQKLEHLDERIDTLAITTTRIESSIDTLNQVYFANQELFEQKLNNNRAAQENIRQMITMKMEMLEDLIKKKL